MYTRVITEIYKAIYFKECTVLSFLLRFRVLRFRLLQTCYLEKNCRTWISLDLPEQYLYSFSYISLSKLNFPQNVFNIFQPLSLCFPPVCGSCPFLNYLKLLSCCIFCATLVRCVSGYCFNVFDCGDMSQWSVVSLLQSIWRVFFLCLES